MATRSGRRRSTSQPTVTTAPTCCGDSSDRDTYAMVSVLSMNDEQILISRFIPSLASIPPRPQLANIFRGPLICVFYLELSVQIVALLSDAHKRSSYDKRFYLETGGCKVPCKGRSILSCKTHNSPESNFTHLLMQCAPVAWFAFPENVSDPFPFKVT